MKSLGDFFPSSPWPSKFDAVVEKRPSSDYFCPEVSGHATDRMENRLVYLYMSNRKSTMERASLCFASLSSGTERKAEPSAMSFETLSEANSSKLRLHRKHETDAPDSNHT